MGKKILAIREFGGLRGRARGEKGEAAEMVNFTVTDGRRLTLRPGVRAVELPEGLQAREITGLWAGFLGQREYLAVATCSAGEYEGDDIYILRREGGGYVRAGFLSRPFGAKAERVHFFTFCGELYALSEAGYLQISDKGISVVGNPDPGFNAAPVRGYVPLVLTAASPAGGGTALEAVNRLTALRRAAYSADGSAEYRLPQEAARVEAVRIDGVVRENAGRFDRERRVFTFDEAPAEGVNNVEITYAAAASDRERVLAMRYSEVYNGDTDSRLFLYGDGSNTCIYSGLTEAGEPSAAYFPAMNEIRVDGGDAPVTALVRHCASLIAFKPDGAWSIVYQALTLADGSVTAGFYLRPLHRSLGNRAMGQVVLVDNSPRTVEQGALYDWKLPGGYHRDERYAVLASGDVAGLLAGLEPGRAVAFDDGEKGDYYLFFGDGRVLVHRYRLDAWCLYRGEAFRDVRFAAAYEGELVFAGARGLYRLEPGAAWDFLPERRAIEALWRSGPLDFGTGRTKKYSARLWVTLIPEARTRLAVAAGGEARMGETEATVEAHRLDYGDVDYGRWTYRRSRMPRTVRVRLRVKKFGAYQAVLRIRQPGCRATVAALEVEAGD